MNCWNQPPELRDELSRRSQDYRQRLEDMKQAGLRTCRDSGIHRPSAVMAERPGVLRDMAIIKDTSQRYQFTSEIGADDDAFNDGVMFDYSDDTYIKTIGEPFPTGFPAQTAIQIAEDYLSTCQDLSERTENTDWQSHRQTGLNALRLAQLRLHSVTPEDVYRFIDRMQNILPPDSEMVSHIMRLITGRDTQAQDLLLAHGLQTVPMTSDNNTNRIIKAARRAGFKKTQLWELARLLNTNPQRYGIERPTLDEHTFQQIALAAQEAGIPEDLITAAKEETSPQP